MPSTRPRPDGAARPGGRKRDSDAQHGPGPARRLARAEEGQDACFDQGARAPAYPMGFRERFNDSCHKLDMRKDSRA